MHGLVSSPETMESMKEMILAAHPGTPVYNIDAFNAGKSLSPMWEQVEGVYRIIEPILKSSPEGAILIGHSQGGLIFRGILEVYPTHNITFIAIAAPMAGQFGDAQVSKLIPLITKEGLYQFCYLGLGKDSTSICNWWKDPKHMSLYEQYNHYLYPLECASDADYKSNFENVAKLVLIGGPDDGIVEPWQSAHFGFYDEHMDLVDCMDQQFYKDNSFGLRTLDDSGRIHMYTVPGVPHLKFHKDQSVFDHCIKQWLD